MGKVERPVNTGELPADFTVTLEVKDRKISGIVTYVGSTVRLLVWGWPLGSSFIRIDYRDENFQVVRHGCTILKLNAQGDALEGRYVGYSPEEEDTVVGAIHMKKKHA